MADFVSRKVGGAVWVVADSNRVIATGIDENEVLDQLESYLGYPVARLEESPIEAFEATIRVAIANNLLDDSELLVSVAQQVAESKAAEKSLEAEVLSLSEQVRSLSERNAALERESRRRERTPQIIEALKASHIHQTQIQPLLNELLRREGLL